MQERTAMDRQTYVIDIGTNSVRMMKAAVADGWVKRLWKTLRTVRTGEGVNASGRLSEAAIERTIGALKEYREIMEQEGFPAGECFCFATSAVRDSANRDEFVKRVAQACGIRVTILSGAEEARYGFAGAVGNGDGGIVDIGGGSTEIIFGRGGEIAYARSFDVGCVRGMEMFAEADIAKVTDWACALFAEAPFSQAEDLVFYAVGGTATALAAIDQHLAVYSEEKVQGYILTHGTIQKMMDWMGKMTLEERRHVIGMEPRRADVILYGLAILSAFFKVSGQKRVIVSEADNMEGYLLCRE